MGDLPWGTIIQGVGTGVAAGSSIASGIQGKNAAEQAQRLQQQALAQSGALGSQSTVLGLAQLDLQRQLADRQIELANSVLGETQPFRNAAFTPSPMLSAMTVGGGATGGGSAQAFAAQTWPNYKGWETLPQYLKDEAMLATGGSGATTGQGGAIQLPDRTFASVPFTQTPAERDTIEAQFRNARGNIISNSPVRGGALASQLRDVEMGRAGAVVGLESDLTRRNQALDNATALTNFQARIDRDRFTATDAMNVRNMNFQDQLNVRNMNAQNMIGDRNLAAQIGFNAPGMSAGMLSSAGAAFNPGAAAQIFNPALAASGQAAQTFGQNFTAASQQSGGSGQALGQMVAAGKLASSKNGGSARGGNTGGFGKGGGSSPANSAFMVA